MSESAYDLQNHIAKLQAELDGMNQKFEEYQKNPKVHQRRMQVLGRQITRLNYTIGNRLVELNKLLEELKH